MIITSLVLATLAQIPDTKPDYTVPIGTSSELHHTIIDISKALAGKDYVTARKLSGLLPKSTLTYRLNTEKLDMNQKAEFEAAISSAAETWQKLSLRQLKVQAVTTKNADVTFSFEPALAKLPNEDMVAGATWFLATEPSQPFVEAVIGLKRGAKLQPVLGRDVYNEALFTFGRYYGLGPDPIYGTAMGRYDGPMASPSEVTSQETTAIRRILTLSDLIRQAVEKKGTIPVSEPSVTIEKDSLSFEPVLQGDKGRSQMVITNKGNAPLDLFVRGDCGCISGVVESPLAPGKSTLLTGVFDTSELVGDVHHNLILMTNDPDLTTKVIPVSISVSPRSEVVFPESNTIYMDGSNKTFTFYINSVEKNIFKILNVVAVGADLSATYEPFDGETSNYLTPGRSQHVRGYKVTVDSSKYNAGALFGRMSAVMYMKTDNPKLNIMRVNLYLQKGIVSLPETVFFGTPKGRTESNFVLTRPGRPFAIKKISSDSKYLSFEVVRNDRLSGSEYFIKVTYDGNAPLHKIKSEIVIETDDPKQGTIRVPVQTSGV
ncbi:MAG: DUF1573 domain-containing protein [Armatimonadetes bacterium]|nr:DUF1573 domain-containing protein [Armatimonadota bacterium]